MTAIRNFEPLINEKVVEWTDKFTVFARQGTKFNLAEWATFVPPPLPPRKIDIDETILEDIAFWHTT